MQSGKISGNQLATLALLNVSGTSILIVPSAIAAGANQDSWLAVLCGLGLGYLATTLYGRLMRMFPGHGLLDMMELALGRFAGLMVSFLFVVAFVNIKVSLTLFDIENFISMVLVQDIPHLVVGSLMMATVVLASRYGVETIVRTSQLLLPIMIFLLLLMVLFLLPQAKISNLQPVLEQGVSPVFKTSLLAMTFFLESFYLMLLIPYVKESKGLIRKLQQGSLIGGGLLFLITLCSVLTIGGEIMSVSAFPSYLIAKKISIGDFIQRIEALMAVIWFISQFFHIATMFYVSVIGLAHVFRLHSHKSITIPLALFNTASSLIVFPNMSLYQKALAKWPIYALPFQVLIPILLIIAHKLRQWVSPLFRNSGDGEME